MKVLILSHSSELGGAERSMLDLFAYWEAKGLVEPHFLIRRPLRTLAKELRSRGWDYTPLYYTNWSNRQAYAFRRPEDIYRNALFNTKAVFEIEKLIGEMKPDVVMTNTIVSPWAAFAAYFQQVPHVWFVREYGDIDHRHIFEVGREKMLQDISTLSSLVATNSKTLANDIKRYADNDKLTTLYNPFNLESLKEKSLQHVKNPFKAKDSLKIVITGRIANTKGQADAAEAIGRLLKLGYDAELCVIGLPSDPGDADSLHHVIKKYQISNKVHLVGHRPNALATVKYADIGVMASVGEAFGRVTFEYMALGLPVIGADSGATPELVEDGKSGYLYTPGSAKSLTEKLIHYAKDRRLIEKHGNSAKAHAAQMMNSEYNADALFSKIQHIVENKDQYVKQPLNIAHRWLEYPGISAKYIKDSGVVSLKRLLYHRLRHRAKWAYLTIFRAINFVRRGFKRSSSL
ncbi:MAG TPA: glycosyltransferase [Candidatus Saccharimonadales bacterium]|nr:glycosyltransferase [Candidatus Saccharimonadales bacterium]